MGRAKERLLLSKMISILTPANCTTLESNRTSVTFENIIIFLATISGIDIPYKGSVKKEMAKIKNLKDFKTEMMQKSPSKSSVIIETDAEHRDTKNSKTGLLNYLPSNTQSTQNLSVKSKYRYGYFDDNKTIIFTDLEREKLRKEFIVFASNRRNFIAHVHKTRVDDKRNQMLHEFDHVPKINVNSKESTSLIDFG